MPLISNEDIYNELQDVKKLLADLMNDAAAFALKSFSLTTAAKEMGIGKAALKKKLDRAGAKYSTEHKPVKVKGGKVVKKEFIRIRGTELMKAVERDESGDMSRESGERNQRSGARSQYTGIDAKTLWERTAL